MALTLESSSTVSAEIDSLKIKSFTFDLVNTRIIIRYAMIDDGQEVMEKVLTLSAEATQDCIGIASFIAQTNVYQPIKSALYEKLKENTGFTGEVN